MAVCCFPIRRFAFRRRRNRNGINRKGGEDGNNGERDGRVRWRFWIRRPIRSGSDQDGGPLLEKDGKKEGRGIFHGIRSRISRVFKRSQNKENPTTASDADQEPDDIMPSLEEEKWDVGMKWEPTEIISRDRTVILATDVFFGSFDQFSDRVQGLGACSVLALTLAQHMIIHPTTPLSKEQFDDLIISGANEWNRMWPLYKTKFPDGHLDLETALTARTCELEQATSKSFTGFHMPDNLEIIPPEFAEYISSGLTFGEIWSGMETLLQSSQGPLIYIVNFANHFFVLRLEREACFIIDSMGGRLDEKCNRAHIIKFSDESLLYREGVDIVRGREACRLHIERLITQSFLGERKSMRGWSMEALMRKFQLEFTCVEHKAARPAYHSDPLTFSGLDKQKFCRGETSASNDSDRMINSEAEKKKGDKQAEEQVKLKDKMARLNWLQNWEGVAQSNRLLSKERTSTFDFRTGQVLMRRTENVKPKADSSRKQENARPELNSDSAIKQEYAGLKHKTDSAIKQKNARPETNSNRGRKPVIRHAAENGWPGEKDSNGTQQKDLRSFIPLVICSLLCLLAMMRGMGQKGFSPDAVHGTKRRMKPHLFSSKCPFESHQKNPVCNYILSQQLEKTKANFKKDPSKEPGLKSSPQRLRKEANFEKDPSKESDLQSSRQRLIKEANYQKNRNTCPLNAPQSPICKEKVESQNQKGFALTSVVMPPVHPSMIPYQSACLPGFMLLFRLRSQKEVGIALLNCFHDAKKFKMNLVRAGYKKYMAVSHWLNLTCHNKWSNEFSAVMESKAWCTKPFFRLSAQNQLPENFYFPIIPLAQTKYVNVSNLNLDSNGTTKQDVNSGSGSWFPIAERPYSAMSQATFAISAIGHRVGPVHANVSCCIVTKKAFRARSKSEGTHAAKAKKIFAACEIETVFSRQLRRLERKLKGCEEFKRCVLKECEGPFNWAHPPKP